MPMQFAALEPLVVAAVRHRGSHDPRMTDATWEQLILWASPRRLLGRSLEIKGVGLLWDDPRTVSADERRYDVAIPIDPEDAESVETPARVLITMPGEYVMQRHHGPY